MSSNNGDSKTSRKRSRQERDNTPPPEAKIQECDMIAYLLEAVRKKRVVEHEEETSLFQKLIIHWVGNRRLELWAAWEDGEIDFIFPEYPDLLFEDKLQEIWKNWEDYTYPLATWIEQFLLAYSEVARMNAVLTPWQEKSLETLDPQRNRKYDIVGSNVIVITDLLLNHLCRSRFPKLAISLQISLGPERFIPRETEVRITCADNEVEQLQRLSLLDEQHQASVMSSFLTKKNKELRKSLPPDIFLEDVLKNYDKSIKGRIERDFDQTRYLAELHVALVAQFQFESLGEILESGNAKKKQRGRTWHFVLNVQLSDRGELVLPWAVKIEYSLTRTEEKLYVMISPMKTLLHKTGTKKRVFEIEQDDKEKGFHDLVQRVRTWIRGIASNNNALRDIMEYLYICPA